MTTIGEAFIKIKPETSQFAGEAQSQVSGALKKVGEIAGAVVIGKGVVDFFKGSAESAGTTNRALRITSQIIKDTGGAANISAKQIDDLARSLSVKTGMDKDSISAAENVVLTHRRIRDELGKGNDVYTRTIQASTDLATVMGTSTTGAAKLLGRALDDPTKAAGALRRAGVILTDQQKAQIAVMVKSGNTMGAQKIVLDALSKSIGGTAVAASSATSRLKAQYADLKLTMGQAIVPSLGGISTALEKVLPSVQPLFATLGKLIGSSLLALAPTIVSIAQGFATIGAALAPVIPPLGAIIGLLAGVFAQGMKLLAAFLGPVVSALAPLVTALVKVAQQGLDAVFKALGPLMPVLGKFVATIASTAVTAIIQFVQALAPLLPIIVLLAGKLLEAMIPAVEGFAKSAVKLLPAMVPLIVQFVELLPLLLPVAKLFADLVVWITPLAPVILGLVLAWRSMGIVTGIINLIKVAWAGLNVVMDMNPFVLIAIAVVALGYVIYRNWSSIQAFLLAAWHAIEGVLGGIADAFRTTGAWIGDTLLAIVNAISRWGERVYEGLMSAVHFFEDLPGQILGALVGLVAGLFNIGSAIITGLINGIESEAGHLIHAVEDILKHIPGVAQVLGLFGSPSPLFHGIGQFIIQGLSNGILSQTDLIKASMTTVAKTVSAQALPALTLPVPVTPLVLPATGAAAVSAGGGAAGAGPAKPGAPGVGGNHLAITIYNPVGETTDTTLHRTMQKIAFHGLLPIEDWLVSQ